MRNIRSRKAFTLIELIIVIVILGILAGIAIVGYNAVINRANESKTEQAAFSYDRSIRALAAFDQGDPGDISYITEMVADVPAGVTVSYADAAGVDTLWGTADDVAPAAFGVDEALGGGDDVAGRVGTVVFTDGDIVVTLTTATESEIPGTVAVVS